VCLLALCAQMAPAMAQEAQPLVIGTLERVATLDPADSGDFFTWEVLAHLYTGLIRQRPGSLEYDLALAVSHAVSADGLVHTFAIRPDAAFSDGTPITARTFAESITRTLRLGGRGAVAIQDVIQSATVDDEGALSIRLARPAPASYLLQVLALPPCFPVHPAQFPSERLIASSDPVIGNGVYRIDSITPRELALVADAAWDGDPPATPRLILRRYDFPADLRDALRAGEIDITWRGLPPDDADIALRTPGVSELTFTGLQSFYALLSQRSAPFDNPAARRALLPLIDRDRAARFGLRGIGEPLYTLVPPPLAGDQAPGYPPFELAAVPGALAEGGFSRFRQIMAEWQTARGLYGDTYLAAADAVSNALVRHEAFRITRFDVVPDTFLSQLERGAFKIMIVGWTPLVPHPEAFLRPHLASDGALAAAAGYDNPVIDALLDQAARLDGAAAAALYDEIQAIAGDAVAAIPLWRLHQVILFRDALDPASITVEPNALLRYDRLRRAG
jgi:peptide/nickel transport system substrate-binding protein